MLSRAFFRVVVVGGVMKCLVWVRWVKYSCADGMKSYEFWVFPDWKCFIEKA